MWKNNTITHFTRFGAIFYKVAKCSRFRKARTLNDRDFVEITLKITYPWRFKNGAVINIPARDNVGERDLSYAPALTLHRRGVYELSRRKLSTMNYKLY